MLERSAYPPTRIVEARAATALALHHNTGDGAGGPSSPKKNEKAEKPQKHKNLSDGSGTKMGGRVEARIKAQPYCSRLVSQRRPARLVRAGSFFVLRLEPQPRQRPLDRGHIAGAEQPDMDEKRVEIVEVSP